MNDSTNATKIDLRALFNAKLIGGVELIGSGKYSNVGMSGMMIVPDSAECVNDYYKDMFLFDDIDTGEYDNLICEGQEITGNFGRHDKVCILGFGQWVDSNDIITVTYEDGSTEVSRFTVPQDVYYSARMKTESGRLPIHIEYWEEGICNVAFLIDRHDGTNGGRIGLYVSECPLNCTDNITSIKLPDNEFINVFAITLL